MSVNASAKQPDSVEYVESDSQNINAVVGDSFAKCWNCGNRRHARTVLLEMLSVISAKREIILQNVAGQVALIIRLMPQFLDLHCKHQKKDLHVSAVEALKKSP